MEEEMLTYRQRQTLAFFRVHAKVGNDFISPSVVGEMFGGHSSIGSPICKRLVELGYLERKGTAYRGLYRLKV